MVGGPLISSIFFNSSYLYLNRVEGKESNGKIKELNRIVRNHMFILSDRLDSLLNPMKEQQGRSSMICKVCIIQ